MLAVIIVTVAAAVTASNLTIDSNLQRLLPTEAPSVESIERLERSYQSALGRLTILLENDDLGDMTAAAPGLADQLVELKGVDRVEYRRPAAYFKQFRLLYADYDDLKTIQKRLKRRIRWEKKRAHPLYIDLSGDEPPEVDVSDIVEKYEQGRGSDYYVNERGDRMAVFVFPDFPAKDLGRSRALVERVKRSVADHFESENPDVEFELTGRYKKRVDLQELMSTDLTMAMLVAIVGLTLFLLYLTRSFAGLALILVPLGTATIWTFAWAQIAFDSLNLLTGFLGAILLGLGVDYGIHLHFHYFEAHRNYSPAEALVRTLRGAGRANLFAGLTTMVPLASLIASNFQAFYEFGTIAVGGIAFVLLAYAVMFPCLVFAFANHGISPRTPMSARFTGRVLPRLLDHEQHNRRFPRRVYRGLLIALGLVAIPALIGAPDARFNRDFHVLQSTEARSWKLDEVVNDILGRSQTPAVVLTESPAHSQQIAREIRRRARDAPGGYTIDQVLSLQSLLPERQSDKVRVLRNIDRELKDLPKKALKKGKLGNYATEIDRVLEQAPLEPAKLPENLTAGFQRTDSGSVVLVFPAVDLTATDKFEDFVRVLRDLPEIEYEKGYDSISEALLLYDIVRYVEGDSLRMLGLTLAGLLVISILALGRLRDSMLQFGILLASIGAAIGWVGLVGAEFNFLNVVILPIWFGLGIDATFHMIFNLRERPTRLGTHLTTGLAVTAAFFTTLIGFGSMLVAHHNGLYSLGEIAVWGLSVMMVANVLVYAFLVAKTRLDSDIDPDNRAGRDDEEVS
jgi:predicted RND superfamily exporter protein